MSEVAQPIQTAPSTAIDREKIRRGITGDGIIGCKGAFSREWSSHLRQDIDAAVEEALGCQVGAVGRGPNR